LELSSKKRIFADYLRNNFTRQIDNHKLKIKIHIPNAVTCCNLLSGCVATTSAFEGDFHRAFLFIIIGALFDFFDGMTARLLHVSSPIGKELDSLADLITFGLAPAAIVHTYMKSGLILNPDSPILNSSFFISHFLVFLPFLLTAFSALRLARFNLDERQTTSFIGLPTPANALFWGALLYNAKINIFESGITLNPSIFNSQSSILFIIALVLLFSWLLVSPIPMFSLKFHNLSWKGNRVRYLFLAVSALLLILLGIPGFAAVIGWYIVLSLLSKALVKTE
jgi:CDP-diacylglycerol--serine O-phosphatidyltransferase